MTGQKTGHTSALDLLAPEHRGLFIGSTWRDAEGGARFDVLDPAGSSVITDVADGSTGDDASPRRGRVAQADWARTPRDRGEILRRAFEMVTARADDFAALMSLEMGKTVAEAKGKVGYGAEFFAGTPRRPSGSTVAGCRPRPAAAGTHHQEAGRAVPVRDAVELPLAMGTRKIGPAVAAGCTMVVKPAAQTRSRCWRWRRCSPRPGCRTACSTWCPPATPRRSTRPCRPTTGCARSASPARPGSAGC